MEDNIWLKTISDGRRLLMEERIDGRQPLMEDNLKNDLKNEDDLINEDDLNQLAFPQKYFAPPPSP